MAEKYILNVWDETQGKYVGIPAIKGDKGDKGDTPVIPIANEAVLGLVTPVTKSDSMKKPVGVDELGKLYVDAHDGPWRYLGKFTTNEDVESFEVTTDSDGNPFSLRKWRVILYTNPPMTQAGEGDIPIATSVYFDIVDEESNKIRINSTKNDYFGNHNPDNWNKPATYDKRYEIDYWTGHPIVKFSLVRHEPVRWGSGDWASMGYQHFLVGAGTYIEIWGIDA